MQTSVIFKHTLYQLFAVNQELLIHRRAVPLPSQGKATLFKGFKESVDIGCAFMPSPVGEGGIRKTRLSMTDEVLQSFSFEIS
jgi:hypothetical protein